MFGVGATKAGTSWLHRYLDSHPDCHLRGIKELHYFDALEEDRLQARHRRARRDCVALAQGEAPRRRRALKAYARMLRDGSPEAYMAFLTDGRKEQSLVGDITPAYALLPEARLRQMAGLAPDVRFVYLLRDPVARLWSHVRMIAVRASRAAGDLAARAAQVLDETLEGRMPEVATRGDYGGALARLAAAVDPTRLLVLFYEELFSEAAIARLCRFLGIGDHPARFDRRVHGGVPLEMSEDQRRRATEWLRPQYDYVSAHMGRLPAKWEASLEGTGA